MLDLWLFLLTVCSLTWMWCIDLIRGRLEAQDGVSHSGLIWRQRGNFTRYWHFARAHDWPIAPLVGGVIAIVCCAIALGGIGIHFLR